MFYNKPQQDKGFLLSQKKIINHQNIFKWRKININMNKWLELLLGLVLVIVAIYFWGMNLWGMGTSALSFLKGGIIWFVIMLGVLFVLLGINEIKE